MLTGMAAPLVPLVELAASDIAWTAGFVTYIATCEIAWVNVCAFSFFSLLVFLIRLLYWDCLLLVCFSRTASSLPKLRFAFDYLHHVMLLAPLKATPILLLYHLLHVS